MSTIVTIIGARPQFIKAAAVSRVLRRAAHTREILVHTGQHYDDNMSRVFFEELDIPQPDHYLGIGSGSHGEQTAKMLSAIEPILRDAQPDWVLVYGDTNSTLAGALAAAKLCLPIAHVEAGLRSFNRRMPEEINRVLTDHMSQRLFAPTESAVGHLLREGISPDSVRLVGDVMYDAAEFYGDAASRSQIVAEYGLQSKGYVMATIHRAENTDDPVRMQAIVGALLRTAEQIPVALPLHPRTRATLQRLDLLDQVEKSLRILPPVGYLDMIALERGARLIVTDSGGVQKEAFFQRVPCLTLRDETEWVELVECGWNRLVPPTTEGFIYDQIAASLATNDLPTIPVGLYGGGQAAEKIVEQLLPESALLAT